MKRPLTMCCVFVMVLCILRFCIYENAFPPGELPSEAVIIQGRVDAWQTGSTQTILYLSDVFFYGDSAKEITQNNSIGILCYIKENREYKLGQSVAVQGFLALPDTASNDGGFDMQNYYRAKGYDYVLFEAAVMAQGSRYDIVLELLNAVKQYAQKQLYRFLTDEDAGIMAAMLLGDKGNMDGEVKTLYREAGIYHILAVSGLHISLLGGGLYKILKILRCRLSLAAIAALSMIWLYGLMIGMPPSAFRAIVMFGFGLAAVNVHRSHDRITSLAVAGCCLILWEPSLFFDSGVQLSFLAVLGIICLYPSFLGLHRYRMKYADGLWVSFAVTYITLPVIMKTYYEVPVYALVANVCVVPLVPVLLMAGIVIIAYGNLFVLPAQIASEIIHYIFIFYEKVLTIFNALPGNRYITGTVSDDKIILFYIVLTALIWFVKKVKRKMLLRSLRSENAYMEGREEQYATERKRIQKAMFGMRMVQGTVLVLLLIFLLTPSETKFRITFLDVGQGDGICVEAENAVYMIDCGSTSEENVGNGIVIPFLKYHGIATVDGWFLTHPDSDHVSAFTELCQTEDLSGIKVNTLYIPRLLQEEFVMQIKLAQQNNIRVVLLERGDAVNSGSLCWTVLAPDSRAFYLDENEASLVLALNYGNFEGVFMGDAGFEAERLIEEAGVCDVTLLKVAHHGSSIGTNSEEFIELLSPQIAVISSGKNNVYGHPHKETIRRLEAVKSKIFGTAEFGQITVEADDDGKVYIK